MIFEKTVIKDPDFPGIEFEDIYYTSGIYKITYYHRLSDLGNRSGYAAYYKPKGWTSWGNYVDSDTPSYKTLKEAKAACEYHKQNASD